MKTTLFIFSIAILSTCASAQEEVFGRPQQPEDRVSLDGHWEMFLTNDPAVTPPHPPEGKAVAVALEGIKNARGPNGWSGLDEPYLHAWYSRKILIPESWDGRRVFVSFLPCLWEARVFLNGQPVGVNTGMLPFTLDITAAAKPGADNDLLVIASGEVALLLDREKDLALLTPTEREEFKRRFFTELGAKDEILKPVRDELKKGIVTLVYASKEERYNNAVALKEYLLNE